MGNFVVSAMEDSGTLRAPAFLCHAGRVNLARVLVLRTVSNYDQQPTGLTPAQSLVAQRSGLFGALLPALESDYAVGHIVIDTITDHWSCYRDHIPGTAASASTAHQ